MSDGFSFDEPAQAHRAPVVYSGGVAFTVWRGDLYPTENLDDHIIRALVMPAPLVEVVMVDLDRHPERVEGDLNTAKMLLSSFG